MAAIYRVGVVGCGVMGGLHCAAWSVRKDTEVVAVADPNEEAARNVADAHSVPAVYGDYHEMLNIEDLDIVSIPTWQGVRAEVTVAAAKAGAKAILGEKPMAASLGQADAMIEACAKSGTKLAIGHQRRFSATANEIRRLVAAGAIGEPTMLFHRAKEKAGLLNIGSHAIDGWRFALSDPRTLWVIGNASRTTDRWERRTRSEDLCMGLVCFEGGARAVYEGDLPKPEVAMPWVYGTEGQIKIGRGGANPADTILLQDSHTSGWQETTPPPIETDQYQELIDWLEGRIAEHRSSGRQARYTTEIMMAIYESLRIKNVVTMPMTTRECPLDLMIDDGSLPVLEEGRYDLRAPFPEQVT